MKQYIFYSVLLVSTSVYINVGAQTAQSTPFGGIGHEGLTQLLTQNSDNEIDWNTIADFLLAAFREEIKRAGKYQLAIPDIEQNFTTKIAFVKVSGNLNATNGWIRDLSSVRRTGDVMISVNEQIYTLSCAMGFGEVALGFDNYVVKMRNSAGITLRGRIGGTVGTNSVALKLEVDMRGETCVATLKEIRVVELNDLKLSLTGFGALNKLVSKLANNAILKRKDIIIKKIEEDLEQYIEKALLKLKCNSIQ